MSWIYEPVGPNGGAEGEAYRIVFNGSGFDAAERVAREAIQNSVDAAHLRDDGSMESPRVSFQIKVLEGQERDAFRRTARLDDIALRKDELDLSEPNALQDNETVLRILYVSDRGTTGLSGDPTKPDSKLRRLLMQIGGSKKLKEDGASGGSYGFGKAVYAGSSRIATIFAYSRTTDGVGEPLSVLMGCAYHVGHEYDGEATSGRAFLGTSTDTPKGTRYDPFVGEEADRLAQELGLSRAEGDLGTTIAIVDCPLEIADLRRGVEKWWWPRILRDNFKVHFYDADGTKSQPKPKPLREIKPFWEAMELTLGVGTEQKHLSKFKDFNATHGKKLGKIGLVALTERVEEDEDGELPATSNTVAMVRSPGMVVNYFHRGSAVRHDPPAVAGVFLADDAIDRILTKSEPPEHDQWDEKADRLETAEERDIVVAVKKRVWNEFRNFKKDARPPAPKPTGRVSELERTLGRILGPATKRPTPPPPDRESSISIVPKVAVVPRDGGLGVEGKVTIGLKPTAEAQAVDVSIALRAIGEGGDQMDRVHIDASGHDAIAWDGAKAVTGRVPLQPGEKIVLDVTSATYDRNWTVRFVPMVEPTSEAETST